MQNVFFKLTKSVLYIHFESNSYTLCTKGIWLKTFFKLCTLSLQVKNQYWDNHFSHTDKKYPDIKIFFINMAKENVQAIVFLIF